MATPSAPVLVRPTSGVKINDNTPTLVFNVPTDADNDNLVFEVEMDTATPINPSSTDYRKFESRSGEGVWQYWNGSTYVEMPSAGMPSSFYGSEAIFTVSNVSRLRNAFWYWQVRVSDQLDCGKFGTASTFAQKKFCAGV